MARRRTHTIEPTTPEAVSRRLELLRRALDLTTTEMCRRIGSDSGGSLWTNYEMGRRVISREHAIRLCEKFGVTLEWIYRGLEVAEIEPKLKKALIEAGGNPFPVFTIPHQIVEAAD